MQIETHKPSIITRLFLITILMISLVSLFIMPVMAATTPDFSPILALIFSVVPIMIILGILGLILGKLR